MALPTLGKDCFLNNEINYSDTQNLIRSFSPSISEGAFIYLIELKNQTNEEVNDSPIGYVICYSV
jgi:hypothetical protein